MSMKIQRGKAIHQNWVSIKDTRRIMRKIVMDEECMRWTGCTDCFGYPRIKLLGKARYVHRVMYAIHNGNVLNGHDIHHTCRNLTCVNPKHLVQCTRRQHIAMEKELVEMYYRRGDLV